MKSYYKPWLLACILGAVVLTYTMSKYNEVLTELQTQRAKFDAIEYKISPGIIGQSASLDGKQRISVSGTFEENRKVPKMLKEFKPESFYQDKAAIPDYKTKLQKLIDQQVPADNPDLVKIIRNHYIEQPSQEPYNLLNPERVDYSQGQTPFIDSRLNYMEGGFYVECGALNGEKGSNSLFFERVRKWNGLLIEGDPTNYAELKKINRKAFSINACISPRATPFKAKFHKAFNMGRAIHDEQSENWVKRIHKNKDLVEIECFPLYSLMLALNRTTIDFFSLDVEGDEVNVLKTIPFDKLNIKMMTVEYAHGGAGGADMQRFLQSKGYEVVLKVSKDNWGVNDLIFRKKGVADGSTI
ncbi:unnamed protein product [Mytilus coruscus]|uniref:Methyltransferase FkbM domain-containing protein n=1 Tax=Mytilus coruscus TaxID=42192 RepID=A0A6J8B606_MYTCO|nr:unnamed protein product [Mytilus coruscus]